MTEPSRGLVAILPAAVRYDPSLRPNGKLLYAEITALSISEGYCWAGNAYLGDCYGISAKTVEGLLHQLEERGYIRREIERDPQTNEVLRRKIWPVAQTGTENPPPLKIEGRSPQKCGEVPLNLRGGPLKNEGENSNYNIPPMVPQRGTDEDRQKKPRKKRTPPAKATWEPDRFEGLWAYYPAEGRKNRAGAIRAWDALQPSAELIARMGQSLRKLKATEKWKQGFGIPYLSTWLNGARWTDADSLPDASEQNDASTGGGWADDPEVL